MTRARGNIVVLHALCDEELFRRFLDGDDAAYTTLYHRYSARLLGYIRSLLSGDPEAADDLFQETFIRLFRERDRCRDGETEAVRNAGGWLFRVARNLTLNHLRSRSYLAPLSTQDETLMVTVEEAHNDFFGDEPDEETLLSAVHEVVQTLPAGLREVFLLREVNGMSYEQTAEIIGCSEEAARMRLSRARSAIRRALQSLFVDR
jgi:RNA polymerase sigma-70 factor (ECF subfamily)